MRNKLASFFENILFEKKVFETIESLIGEDYPSSFSIDEFKHLSTFKERIKYCQQHLKRISSGSGRIVYKIDDEKVLKLAKNKKGIAQIDVEVDYSKERMLKDVVANIFNYHEDYLWVEMELARKLTEKKFLKITGLDWTLFTKVLFNYDIDANNPRREAYKYNIDPDVKEQVWENEFAVGILDLIGTFHMPAGDLMKLNSYGIVQRNGEDHVILIDYGLTSDVYDSYYM